MTTVEEDAENQPGPESGNHWGKTAASENDKTLHSCIQGAMVPLCNTCVTSGHKLSSTDGRQAHELQSISEEI